MESDRDGGESPTPGLNPAAPGGTEQEASPNPGPAAVPPASRLRKFFVLRPGMLEQALADIKAQIDPQTDGPLQSSWLLTEVDHWNNEKERIVMISERSLVICKYDFVMLNFQSCRKVPLNYIDKICYGQLTFPEYSISRALGNVDAEDLLREVSAAVSAVPAKEITGLQILSYNYSNNLVELHSNLTIALRLMLTVPVTVASGERSLSRLTLIKKHLRTTMIQERLLALAQMSTVHEITRSLDKDKLIKAISTLKLRREMKF
ncbi:uncharacterized protein [Hemitrygon akajei]|uniref:uncharacterized protein n=1 Tax=Hemitrygon akajei TaxID=2704970 RepID=UPI003BF9557F